MLPDFRFWAICTHEHIAIMGRSISKACSETFSINFVRDFCESLSPLHFNALCAQSSKLSSRYPLEFGRSYRSEYFSSRAIQKLDGGIEVCDYSTIALSFSQSIRKVRRKKILQDWNRPMNSQGPLSPPTYPWSFRIEDCVSNTSLASEGHPTTLTCFLNLEIHTFFRPCAMSKPVIPAPTMST